MVAIDKRFVGYFITMLICVDFVIEIGPVFNGIKASLVMGSVKRFDSQKMLMLINDHQFMVFSAFTCLPGNGWLPYIEMCCRPVFPNIVPSH